LVEVPKLSPKYHIHDEEPVDASVNEMGLLICKLSVVISN